MTRTKAKPCLRQTHTCGRPVVVVTAVGLALLSGSNRYPTSAVAAAGAVTDNEFFVADASSLGVVRRGGDGDPGESANTSANLVSIDFDAPRYGPICVSVDDSDGIEFVWEEYHNLHQLPDETSFRSCDFSEAVPLVPQGKPRPLGYAIESSAVVSKGNASTLAIPREAQPPSSSTGAQQNSTVPSEETAGAVRYYACSKICRSNGHKVKVCTGGEFGETNECTETPECGPDRTVDMRTTNAPAKNDSVIGDAFIASVTTSTSGSRIVALSATAMAALVLVLY